MKAKDWQCPICRKLTVKLKYAKRGTYARSRTRTLSHPLFPGVGIGVRDCACAHAHTYCDFALTVRDWFRRGVMWAGAQDLPETPKSSKRRNIRAIDTTLSQEEKDAWEEELKERKLLEQLTAKRAADTADHSDSDDDDFGGGGGGGGGSARGIRINDNILVVDKEEAVYVHPDISRMLKPHQKEGLRFMWHRLIKTMAEVGNPGTDRKDRVYGGILAHSMGLGKTLQTIALIHTVLTCKAINRQGAAAAAAKRKGKEKEGSGVDGDGDSAGAGTNIGTVLILVPKNVLYNWHKEFVKWIPDQAWTKKYVKVLNSDVMTDIMERSKLLKAWADTGGVMIMTDSMYVKMMEVSTSATQKYTAQVKRKIKERAEMYLHKPGPDMIFIDEAHILGREVSKRTERILGIHTRRRMLLTGTPMQNSLKEYFSMIDFIYPKYMGTKEQFANRFTNPIENGQYNDSTEKDILMMRQRLCVLQSKVRRMVQRKDQAVFLNELKGKREYVIYIPLTKEQRKLYKRYNDYAAYNEDSNGASGKGSFFAAFQSLQKVSSHPYTLRIEENQAKQKAKSKVAAKKKKERELLDGFDDLDPGGGGGSKASSPGKSEATDSDADDPLEEDEEEDDAFDTTSSSNSKKNKWFSTYPKKEPNDLLRDSGKFKLFFEILQLCEAKGDKLVLFTQHVITLDVLEVQLKRMKWKKNQKYLRIDGKDDAKDRLEMADKFNEAGSKLQLIIASVKATALGINFTGANRVIIFDHSHNPVHEIQAIARTYRYGQQKEVVVYRFVADRTIDQKIYVRQCEYGETTDRCFEIESKHGSFTLNERDCFGTLPIYKLC